MDGSVLMQFSDPNRVQRPSSSLQLSQSELHLSPILQLPSALQTSEGDIKLPSTLQPPQESPPPLQTSQANLQLSPALQTAQHSSALHVSQANLNLHSNLPKFQDDEQLPLARQASHLPPAVQISQGNFQPSSTPEQSQKDLQSPALQPPQENLKLSQSSGVSSELPISSRPISPPPSGPVNVTQEPNPKEIERPSTPVHVEMTRDQRIQARTLHSTGLKYSEIVTWFKEHDQGSLTYRQVSYACKTRATPQKRSGRPPRLTDSQVDELIEFITSSEENRRMPYWQVAINLGWEGLSENTIRSSLRRVGYSR